jgi:ABC-2 type transport system permease protein
MTLVRAGAIVLRQFYLVRGSPARIVPLFAWVALDIILWGFITRYLRTITSMGETIVPTLLGAVLLWDFFSRVMQGVTIAFFEDVWSRNFLNVFATPITIGEYLAGLVISAIATSTIGLLVMLTLAAAAFGLTFVAYGAVILPALLVLFLFGIALGIVSCALVLRLGPSAEWFVWPIPGLLSPFAGVFYPVSTLPAWMHPVAYALPPAYVFEALRALLAGQPVSAASLAGAAVLAIGYVVVGGWIFTRVYRQSVRTGLLARYAAESVT